MALGRDFIQQLQEQQHRANQLEAERDNLRTQLNSEILNIGHRGLAWINAVGAGALVTWLQNSWDKTGMEPLRPWLIAGAAVLLLGVAIASSAFWLRYRNSFDERGNTIGESPWWRWIRNFTFAAIGCFVLGMGLAITGAIRALAAIG